MVRTVFGRLYELDPTVEEHKIAYAPEEAAEGEVRMNVTTDLAEPNNPSEGSLDPQAADLSVAAEAGSTIAESVEPPQPTGPRPECMCTDICIIYYFCDLYSGRRFTVDHRASPCFGEYFKP
jgi:hypothetical protein